MKSFWQYLQEITDVMTTDVGNIQLTPFAGGYTYEFEDDDGDNYKVSMYKKMTGTPFAGLSTVNGYGINFYGPEDTGLTNKYKANQVYRQLMMAVKKLIEQENPESLSFTGAEDEQTIMYDTFYKKFLRKAYTRVNSYSYLRNDIIEKYKDQPDAQQKMANADRDHGEYVQQIRQDKIDSRNGMIAEKKKMEELKRKIQTGIGKIGWGTPFTGYRGTRPSLFYIKGIRDSGYRDTFYVEGYSYSLDQLREEVHRAQAIEPFNAHSADRATVNAFINLLQAKGIMVQGYYE